MFKILVVTMAFLTAACASQSKNLSEDSRTPAQATIESLKTDPNRFVTINQPYGQIVHISSGYDSSLEILFSNGKTAVVSKIDAITQQLIIGGFTAKKNIDYQIEETIGKTARIKKVFVSFYPNTAY